VDRELAAFDVEILHKKGKDNVVATSYMVYLNSLLVIEM